MPPLLRSRDSVGAGPLGVRQLTNEGSGNVRAWSDFSREVNQRPRNAQRKLALERLEARQLLAGDAFLVDALPTPPDIVQYSVAAKVAVAAVNPVGDTPLIVGFIDTSTMAGITGWHWSFGDGSTSTTQSPTHAYATPGVYDVILTVTTGEGEQTITQNDFVVAGYQPEDTNQDGTLDHAIDVANLIAGWGSTTQGQTTRSKLLAGDNNLDGKVDMIDAFWLRKALKANQPPAAIIVDDAEHIEAPVATASSVAATQLVDEVFASVGVGIDPLPTGDVQVAATRVRLDWVLPSVIHSSRGSVIAPRVQQQEVGVAAASVLSRVESLTPVRAAESRELSSAPVGRFYRDHELSNRTLSGGDLRTDISLGIDAQQDWREPSL